MERNYTINISELSFAAYRFKVNYFEKSNQNIPEFPHKHDWYEIYHILEGSATFTINNTWYVVHEGETVFISKNVIHHVHFEPVIPKKYFAIIFDYEPNKAENNRIAGSDREYEDIKSVLNQIEGRGYLISNNKFGGDGIVEEILEEKAQKGMGWNTQVTMLAYRFVTRALRSIKKTGVLDIEPAGQRNLAMEITMYIHEHYMEDITIEDVARDLNVSVRHLNREYKNNYGITFGKNLNRLRMEYAKDFICNTVESIEKIVEKVGLSSTTMLYNMFQESEGMSVSQYRKRYNSILGNKEGKEDE